MTKARKLTLTRLNREVKAVRRAFEPQVYVDGHDELCISTKPAVYSWPGIQTVWGQVA